MKGLARFELLATSERERTSEWWETSVYQLVLRGSRGKSQMFRRRREEL